MQRKPFVRIAFVVVAALSAANALALTNLKAVTPQAQRVELVFDGKVAKPQVTTDFFNDVIQLSVSDVAVYPAKISSVSGGDIAKVFAYQYAPKLVRCRFTVKGKAEDFKDRVQVAFNGKSVVFKILPVGAAAQTDASSEPAAAHAGVKPVDARKPAPVEVSSEEKALLDRVIRSQAAPAEAPIAAAAPKVEKMAEKAERKVEKSSSENKPIRASENKPIAGGKAPMSPFHAMGRVALVLALFGICALVIKKFAAGKASLGAGDGRIAARGNENSMLGAINRFARKNLNRKARMIEVVTTQSLGPKKSIAVVRVGGRMLVLGVANDSITLITQLSTGAADSFTGIEDLEDLGIQIPSMGEERPAPAAAQKPSRLTQAAAGAAPDMFADLLGGLAGPQVKAPAPLVQAPVAPAAAVPAARAVATQMGPRIGAHNLTAYGAAPAVAAPAVAAAPAVVAASPNSNPNSAVRQQIRSRLEGLKPL